MAAESPLCMNYFWTWDHRCNWVLDEIGLQTEGDRNPYIKVSETFVEDYRRVTDFCAAEGIGGIAIYGFLRDSHGGIESAREVARYAASKGVRILPGLGTTAFGGVYYRGRHEFNLETFLERHPGCAQVQKDGTASAHGLCPTHPDVVRWMEEGAQWLMETFEIGGVNVENGDFQRCYCERCEGLSMEARAGEPEFFQQQLHGYLPTLQALKPHMREKWVQYATYTGFAPGEIRDDMPFMTGLMGAETPAFVSAFPEDAVCQWTVTGMVREKPLPLTAYLDCGAPDDAYDNPRWPKGLRAPTAHSTGYLHSGGVGGRYGFYVSTIKEACLRSAESGLEGLSIYGEMTPRYVPWWLHYQAFAHFTRHPDDDLRGFARARLAPVLGEEPAQVFVECLAKWDAGTHTEGDLKRLCAACDGLSITREAWPVVMIWQWLIRVMRDGPEPVTRSFF